MVDVRLYFDFLEKCEFFKDDVLDNIMIDGYVKMGKNGDVVYLYRKILEKGIDLIFKYSYV